MDRLIAPNSVPFAQADTAPVTGTPQYATDGDPATNVPATLWPAYAFNALQDEIYNVVVSAGLTPNRAVWNQLLTAIQTLIGQPQTNKVSGVVGQVRNLSASLAAAGTSLTLTADEVIVETALGGVRYCLPSFNQTVSTTSTGIGGVVGTALTASGFAAIYGAYNPTTQAQGAFIVNANTLAPNVAVAPPSGWVATGLISVWPLNASTQFIVGLQKDRDISFLNNQALSSGTIKSSYTALSLSTIIPLNAKKVSGTLQAASTSATTAEVLQVGGDANGSGTQACVTGGATVGNGFAQIPLATPQTIYYLATNSAGTPAFGIAISGYSF